MRERWLTPQTLKSLQAENVIGDTWDAVLRVPLVEVTNEGTRVTARPGTVVRVIGHQVRGDTRVTILLDHNVSVTLRPEERSGFIPLTVANQMPAQAGGVEHPLYTHADWKAEAARGARSVSYRQWLKEREDLDVRRRETWFRGTDFRNLRGKHDFTVHIHGNAVLENRPGKIGETVTFAPGDVVALESAEFSGAVGHVVLKTREGGLFTLKTRDAAGTLPISLIIPQHQRDRAIHPREDWMAAMKATGAQGVYQAWFQSVIGSEIRDGWLSEADAQTLKPGDRVTMQVYGDTDPHDPQGESYTLDYAPGTHVTFLTRFPKEGVIRYTFKTSEGGVFSMSPSERGGFLPISRYVSVDPDFDAWIQEVETLLSQSVSPDEWKAYYHLGYAPVNAVSAYRTATRNAP